MRAPTVAGRRLLITGASSGIGMALTREAVRRGWRVVLVGRDVKRLSSFAHELRGSGHEVLVADLATAEGVEVTCMRLRAEENPCDGIINAAGLGTTHPFPWGTIEDERRMLDVNVRAVLELSHVAAEVLRRRGAGVIVNVSSTAAYWSAGTYAGSKSWVTVVTQGLARQCRGTGVRVMALAPGFTRTTFHGRSNIDASGVRPWMWLTAEEVARAAFQDLDAGREVSIPGWRYRLLVGSVRHLTPAGRAWAMRWLAPLRPYAAD